MHITKLTSPFESHDNLKNYGIVINNLLCALHFSDNTLHAIRAKIN